MVQGLTARGHQVTLCTTDARDARARLPADVRSGAATEHHVFPNVSNHGAYHLQAFVPIGLSRFLRQRAASFDVAHIHACHNVPGIMAARALALAGIAYVVSPNGTAPVIERRRALKHLLGWLGGWRVLQGASRVLAVSAAEERQLVDLGVSMSRIARVPNPVDLREFESQPDGQAFRQSLGAHGPLVLFLGKITPRKAVTTVVEAFAALGSPDARLVLAGNDMGGLAPALRQATRLHVRERTHAPGLLTGRSRLEALAAADVVVYASSHEVFGLVPCEALLAGSPVVVGDDSGAAEVIALTGGGCCVPPYDARALGAALARVLNNRAEWRRDAQAAAVRVRTLFGSDGVASTLEGVYAGLLGHRERVSA